MNRQVAQLAVFTLVLLAALIIATTYWQTWAAAGLADRQDNAIMRVAQFTIKRGEIKSADGTVLATNVPKRVEGHTLYFRRYPTGALFAHLVGYSTQSRSRAGLERSENSFLTGADANLTSLYNTTINQLKGVTVTGNDLHLTLRAGAQRLAMGALAGQCGAAVALDPRTGKVLVMASQPSYDPNLVERNFNLILRAPRACTPGSPLLNRATDGLFSPGSTFKVVTASAALNTGRYTIDSTFNDPGYCIEYGKQVHNSLDQNGPEIFGSVNFTQALQHSINAVFCDIGKAIGAGSILDYSKRYGFYARPPLETPSNERAPSGLYDHHKLFFPRHPETAVDPGRLAFGQERMLATPLQMAMVAGAVANGGREMRPYAVDHVTDPGGSTISTTHPEEIAKPISRKTAQDLTSMMEAVVTGGTGTAAQIPGIRVAGKTGTAETGGTKNTTWFLAFAPADNPKVAVAVVLENQTGYGGTTAAPIAKTILQALLSRR